MRKCALLACFVFWTSLLNAETDPLRKVAQELADGLHPYKNVRIAVLPVPHHDNHASGGPTLVSERLTTYLAMDGRISLLERGQINRVLEELHLSQTGVLNPGATRRIGQALGADVIVTGTLIDLNGGKTEINARGLLAENGQVVAASRAILPRTWDNRPVLAW